MRKHFVFVLVLVGILGVTAAIPGLGFAKPGAPGEGAAPAALRAPKVSSEPTMYLSIIAEVQGEINGGVTKPGREGTIEVYGFSHEVLSPRDAASGLPTGKRQHKPLIVTKAIDQATPQLANALYGNENLVDVHLEFYRPGRGGSEIHYYTIDLVNASIGGIQSETEGPHTQREHVAFTYQKIIQTWQDPQIVAEDDWETPTD